MILMAALLTGSALAPAAAAVRVCLEPVAGEAREASTDLEARRLALESWTSKALAAGARAPIWRTAVDQHLRCLIGANGLNRCQAIARPCTIEQVPPPGLVPIPRDPGRKI